MIAFITRKSPLSFLPKVLTYAAFYERELHPKYVDAEIRCACGNVIKTRSTKPVIIVGICNACHPFYTGQQKFVDTAGRVDKFQQRMAKTQAAQAARPPRKRKSASHFPQIRPHGLPTVRADCFLAQLTPGAGSMSLGPGPGQP